MHWSSILSAATGFLLTLPIGVLVSECSGEPSSYKGGVPKVTQSEEVLVTRSVPQSVHAALVRSIVVDKAEGASQRFTAVQWQRNLESPWLRVELPGHPDNASLSLQDDGTVMAQIDKVQIRIRAGGTGALKQ